jgi:hypothetical protein
VVDTITITAGNVEGTVEVNVAQGDVVELVVISYSGAGLDASLVTADTASISSQTYPRAYVPLYGRSDTTGPVVNSPHNYGMAIGDGIFIDPAFISDWGSMTLDQQKAIGGYTYPGPAVLMNTSVTGLYYLDSPDGGDGMYPDLIPKTQKWAFELFFKPSAAMATTIGTYVLMSYRNNGSLSRHLYFAFNTYWDSGLGTYAYALRRRNFGLAPSVGSQVPFPNVCFGRWNQLVFEWNPTTGLPTDGYFKYWWNGEPWFDSGNLVHGGEDPPSITRIILSAGWDGYSLLTSAAADPFDGHVSHWSLYQGSDMTDAQVAERWRLTAGRCGNVVELQEV